MKNLLFILGTLVALSSGASPSLKGQEQDQRKARRARAVEQLYSPTCPAPAHYKAGNCGFMEESFTEAEVAKLDACRSGEKESCDADFRRSVVVRWQARYAKANAASVGQWCADNARDCDNLALAELQWMDSHNRAVLNELQQASAAMKARPQAAAERAGAKAPALTQAKGASAPAAPGVPAAPSVH